MFLLPKGVILCLVQPLNLSFLRFLSFILKDLIHSFELEKPLTPSRPPLWNLDDILRALRGAPYEPLAEANLRYLTKKTTYLLYGYATRVNEFQALSFKVAFCSSYVCLSYLPEFVAKTNSERNFVCVCVCV